MKTFLNNYSKLLLKTNNKNLITFNSLISNNFSTSTQVQPWVEKEDRLSKLRGELILSDRSHIKNYAIDLVKNYYRSTNKEAITLDSTFEKHGLDSLDAIELCCQLEDELGYIIEAETMTKINKVKHIVNFIEQLEAYKQEFKTMPQERATDADENWDDWMPKGEIIKTKLFGYTKKDHKTNNHDNHDNHEKHEEHSAKH